MKRNLLTALAIFAAAAALTAFMAGNAAAQQAFTPVSPTLPAGTPANVDSVKVSQLTLDALGSNWSLFKLADLTSDDNGYAIPKPELAEKAIKSAVAGSVKSYIALPIAGEIFTAYDTDTMTFAYNVTGDKLFCDSLSGLKAVKIFADGSGALFKTATKPEDFKDEYVTILKDGAVYTGKINPSEPYTICAFIKATGRFNMINPAAPAAGPQVLDPMAVVETGSSSSGGGCQVGFGALVLLAMAFAPAVMRKARRR
ncbi:MAG: hypothetical protein Q4F74_04480 [Synergistaceae bacterium]|nr:hypothetical protein [Synergistaceae bacterium]